MGLVVHVLVALALMNAAAAVKVGTRTLDDLFLVQYGVNVNKMFIRIWSKSEDFIREKFGSRAGEVNLLPLSKEIIQYLKGIDLKIMSEYVSDFGNVTLQTILDDLNMHCAEDLETPIEDLRVKLSNVTCVRKRLKETLAFKLIRGIHVGLQKSSRECTQQLLPLCSGAHANCSLAYEDQMRNLVISHIEEAHDVEPIDDITPLGIIGEFLVNNLILMTYPYVIAVFYLNLMSNYISSVPSIEPFVMENMLQPTGFRLHEYDRITQSQDHLTWGIVRSNNGSVDHPCSNYRDIYQRGSEDYFKFFYNCYLRIQIKLTRDLISCVHKDPTTTPLTWSTAPSAYFHSQCLCLAYNGTECGVKPPQGVDPLIYCLSVLLRDFQRQVSYRPAVTYLDYVFQTRVPVCQFTNLLQIAFNGECKHYDAHQYFHLILSVQCYFKDVVNKHLNCSEIPLFNTYNGTELCALKVFMDYVLCHGDVKLPVPYYGAGDSTLVLGLTFLDVAVRVLTLFTYLACPQLRNLPGKLLIGYQVTALLRLLVVRASLVDMAVAVRLDVAMDLASTLWLTSYLHFLTTSIMTLRLPDSLSRDEAHMVLRRYALLGWALPTALSATFFWMDEALDSRVQIGQLLFVLCTYVALFGNLYMFYKNFQFYYDVKKSALQLRQGVTARSVYADLFIFALKTSLLSGAGITFRLLFTQIKGLEHLLGYYHALGTLQGLMFFVLYGCNSEARAFWKLVLFTKLPLWCRRRNTIV